MNSSTVLGRRWISSMKRIDPSDRVGQSRASRPSSCRAPGRWSCSARRRARCAGRWRRSSCPDREGHRRGCAARAHSRFFEAARAIARRSAVGTLADDLGEPSAAGASRRRVRPTRSGSSTRLRWLVVDPASVPLEDRWARALRRSRFLASLMGISDPRSKGVRRRAFAGGRSRRSCRRRS